MVKRICDVCNKEITEKLYEPLWSEWFGSKCYDVCPTCHKKYGKMKRKAEKEAFKALLKSKGAIDIPEDEE